VSETHQTTVEAIQTGNLFVSAPTIVVEIIPKTEQQPQPDIVLDAQPSSTHAPSIVIASPTLVHSTIVLKTGPAGWTGPTTNRWGGRFESTNRSAMQSNRCDSV